jgi:hypothetical protein
MNWRFWRIILLSLAEETMAESEALHFNITITSPNSTDNELDHLTRQL